MSLFSDNLKNIRLKNNIKRITLAEYLNIGPRALSYYESGTREPSFEKLIKISNFFDVSTDYLLGRTSNPNSHKEQY